MILVNGKKASANSKGPVFSLLKKLGINPEEAVVFVDGALAPETRILGGREKVAVLEFRQPASGVFVHKSAKEGADERVAEATRLRHGAERHAENKAAVPCSDCGRESVAYLPYSKKNLCRKHFIRNYEKRAMRTVREFGMVRKGETVIVGLSGGKDSVVLLRMLHLISQSLPFKLRALCVDMGIKGYISRTLPVAKRECKKLKVPLTIVSLKNELGFTLDEAIRKMGKERSCSLCGVLRRYLINKACRRLGASKLAIGHNLDDISQTVLMNIMRNEPARLARFGLVGGLVEDESFIPRIKPLARCPEKEDVIYAVLNGISINYGPCPYAQAALRQHVRAQLNETEQKYPGTKFRIMNSYLALTPALVAYFRTPELKVAKCARCGEPASGNICGCCKMLSEIKGVR